MSHIANGNGSPTNNPQQHEIKENKEDDSKQAAAITTECVRQDNELGDTNIEVEQKIEYIANIEDRKERSSNDAVSAEENTRTRECGALGHEVAVSWWVSLLVCVQLPPQR